MSELRFAGNLADIDSDGELTIENLKQGGNKMPRPKGHKKNCQCAVCRAQRKGKTPRGKHVLIIGGRTRKPHAAHKARPLTFPHLPVTGAVEQHKAYSYVNKQGKTIHVAAHTEHR